MDHSIPSSPGPALDRSMLLELRELGVRQGPAFVGRLREIFRVQASESIATARRQIAASDTDSLAQTAHSLKGGCANLALAAAAKAAAALESAARDGDLATATARLASLETTLQEGMAALDSAWPIESPGGSA